MKRDEFRKRMFDGTELYYQGWEPDGAARDVVCLVHGLGEHSGRYALVATHLCDAGCAVLAFDQRGHGRSEGRRGHSPSYETTMDDIGVLLAESASRYPGLPAFLYGHSLGGSLVMNYALRRRPGLAGVIATGPALRPAVPVANWKKGLAGLLCDRLPALQMPNGLDVHGMSRDAEIVAAYRADPLVHDRVSVRVGSDLLTSGEWALSHASDFPLPLLLIHGSADRITCPKASSEFAVKSNGHCTFVLVDGGYHELHNEPGSREVLDTIVAWLNQHTPTKPGEYQS